jgi:hypothetical protein
MVRASSILPFARQLLGPNEGRHDSRGSDRVAHRPTRPDKAEKREERHVQGARRQERHREQERDRPQRLGARHQPRPRDPVRHEPDRDREQDEGQGLRDLKQARAALVRPECQDGDDRGRGERDLLGRLRSEVGPGEPAKVQRKGVRGVVRQR